LSDIFFEISEDLILIRDLYFVQSGDLIREGDLSHNLIVDDFSASLRRVAESVEYASIFRRILVRKIVPYNGP
jgi:hypothetical protein